MEKEKLKIELKGFSYSCADGCCSYYGVNTIVNGKEMPSTNEDSATILKNVLEHLGYEVEIIETFE